MATTVKSAAVTAKEFPTSVYGKAVDTVVRWDSVTVATTSIDEVNDAILMLTVPSNAKLRDLEILCTDMDTNGTPTLAVDIGLAYAADSVGQKEAGKTVGLVADQDAIASAITTLQTGATSWTSVRFEAASVTTVDQPVWQLAGDTEDRGGNFYIVVTVTAVAATAAAGTLAMRATLGV